MPRFDLVHQPWIPVMVPDGTVEVSLHDALTNAHTYLGLDVSDPLQAVAVFRQVLMPIYLDATGLPRTRMEWAQRWEAARLDANAINTYLEEHAARFDLFDPDAPFAQTGGLRTGKGETKPTSVLLPATATGNNVPLFGSRTDANPPPLSPAQATRALLSVHCWDTAAIKSGAVGDPAVKAGKTTGNLTGPTGQLGVLIPTGRTLAETMLLNTPVLSQGLRPGDSPHWRRPPQTPAWSVRPAAGLLDLLTFPARRVRLLPRPSDVTTTETQLSEVTAAVTTADDEGTVVTSVVLCAGDRLPQGITPEFEPHTQWRTEKQPKADAPPRRPQRHQPGRAAWRGLASMLATAAAPTAEGASGSLLLEQIADLREDGHLPQTYPLQVISVGVAYGNQSAVIEDVILDTIPLPITALAADSATRQLLLQIVSGADALRIAANSFGDDLRRAAGGDKLPWDRSYRLGESLVHDLTPVVRRLLTGLQRQPERLDDAEHAWAITARRHALAIVDEAVATTGPSSFLGRADSNGHVHRMSSAVARYRRTVFEQFPQSTYPETATPPPNVLNPISADPTAQAASASTTTGALS